MFDHYTLLQNHFSLVIWIFQAKVIVRFSPLKNSARFLLLFWNASGFRASVLEEKG